MSLPASQEETHTEEEVSPDRALTLRQIFGEKLIDFRTMDRLLQAASGITFAQILVAVGLMGLTFLDMPTISVDGEENLRIAVPILGACVLFMGLAWTYLLAGALHARPAVRIPVWLLFLGTHSWVAFAARQAVLTGWMPLAALAGYLCWQSIARPGSYRRDFLVTGGLLAYLYITTAAEALLTDFRGQVLLKSIEMQIGIVSIALFPLIIFSGLDLGESVRDLSRWVIGQGAARSGDRLLLGVVLLIGLTKLSWLGVIGDMKPDWIAAGIVLAAAGALLVRFRHWKGLGQEPPFTMLLVFALCLALLFLGPAVAQAVSGNAAMSPGNVAVGLGIPLAAAAGLGFFWYRGKPSASMRTELAYLSVFAVWNLAFFLSDTDVWNGALGFTTAAELSVRSIDGAATLLVTGLLLVLAARGRASRALSAWALMVIAGLSTLRFMVWMAQGGLPVPAAAATAQLAVMAAGLLWDLLTSGDKWTNRHTPLTPRSARVLLYFGYVMMTVTALLYWKARGEDGFFDTDLTVLAGVNLLGIPLLLYGFARSGIVLAWQSWASVPGPAQAEPLGHQVERDSGQAQGHARQEGKPGL